MQLVTSGISLTIQLKLLLNCIIKTSTTFLEYKTGAQLMMNETPETDLVNALDTAMALSFM
jgi:hypothetical protein